MIRLLISLLFTFSVHAAVSVEMDFSATMVHQGQLVETRLQLRNAEKLQLQRLKGQTVGKVVHFYDVSPMVKREGADYYEADAKVIFTKVPEARGVKDVVAGEEVELSWGELLVNPTQAEKSLIFGDFDVPERSRWVFWTILALVGAILAGLLARGQLARLKKKREARNRLLALKAEVLGARNYEDVVNLWRKKHLLLDEFPHLQDPFDKLEEVLNRHQFKPKQSEAEKIEIVEAYRKFSRSVEGGFNGI